MGAWQSYGSRRASRAHGLWNYCALYARALGTACRCARSCGFRPRIKREYLECYVYVPCAVCVCLSRWCVWCVLRYGGAHNGQLFQRNDAPLIYLCYIETKHIFTDANIINSSRIVCAFRLSWCMTFLPKRPKRQQADCHGAIMS